MRLSLGIDTGGTYTDAVLFDDTAGPRGHVVATAKALTTRHDLAVGIAGAVDAVLAQAGAPAAEIALVSLSTTLATNALVEGRGGRVALIFIGFGESDAARSGLAAALHGDPLIMVAGGHSPHGEPVQALDLVTLEREARAVAPTVSGFAVTAQFATRNPEHEIAARELLQRVTGWPVTCGHELSAKLDGPRRALTSVLNARLIGLITGLIAAAEQIMVGHGIEAPLMVVRGDGALMSAAMAKARPIETILSGPAASLVGGAYLTGSVDAIVADIGGTTTDIAVIEGGAPRLDENGATVGGHRTMVEAVAMTTVGLGGDSEVTVTERRVDPTLRLGPRRVIPICLMAMDHPDIVHRALERQLLGDAASEHDARFVVPIAESGTNDAGLDPADIDLLERVRRGPAAVSTVIRRHSDLRRLDRLVARGLAMLSAFTPTDASHVVGDHVAFDADASRQAALLMARKRSLVGKPFAAGAEAFAAVVVAALQRQSSETILEAVLARDGFDQPGLSAHPLLAASLDGRTGAVAVTAALTMPLVALGASAGIYYGPVAAMLRTRAVIPDHADAANAVGAVVGRVRVHADVYISQPERGRFRVHHADAGDDVFSIDDALARAETLATGDSAAQAIAAGADHVETLLTRAVNVARIEGEEYVVDATVTAVSSGRPRMAR